MKITSEKISNDPKKFLKIFGFYHVRYFLIILFFTLSSREMAPIFLESLWNLRYKKTFSNKGHGVDDTFSEQKLKFVRICHIWGSITQNFEKKFFSAFFVLSEVENVPLGPIRVKEGLFPEIDFQPFPMIFLKSNLSGPYACRAFQRFLG